MLRRCVGFVKNLKFFFLILFGSFSAILLNHYVQLKQYSDIGEIFISDDHIAELDADDSELIEHIRKYYLEPPAEITSPYNLHKPNNTDWSQNGQSVVVENYFNGKTDGFFVECGAYDGETWSNTLSLEIRYNWTGLLIEADYANFKVLREKRRKAWLFRGCLHGGSKPRKATLAGGGFVGGLLEHTTFVRRFLIRLYQPLYFQTVWCFPLLSILSAVNRTKIDYFSLDVEGAEMEILTGIPYDKIDIDVIQVEYILNRGLFVDKQKSTQRKELIRKFVETSLPDHDELAALFSDIIFVKNVTAV